MNKFKHGLFDDSAHSSFVLYIMTGYHTEYVYKSCLYPNGRFDYPSFDRMLLVEKYGDEGRKDEQREWTQASIQPIDDREYMRYRPNITYAMGCHLLDLNTDHIPRLPVHRSAHNLAIACILLQEDPITGPVTLLRMD